MFAKKRDRYSVFAGYGNVVCSFILRFCSLHGISGGESVVPSRERGLGLASRHEQHGRQALFRIQLDNFDGIIELAFGGVQAAKITK